MRLRRCPFIWLSMHWMSTSCHPLYVANAVAKHYEYFCSLSISIFTKRNSCHTGSRSAQPMENTHTHTYTHQMVLDESNAFFAYAILYLWIETERVAKINKNFSLLFTQKLESIRRINTQCAFATATVTDAVLASLRIATNAMSFGVCWKRQILCYCYFTIRCKCQTVKKCPWNTHPFSIDDGCCCPNWEIHVKSLCC